MLVTAYEGHALGDLRGAIAVRGEELHHVAHHIELARAGLGSTSCDALREPGYRTDG